MATKRVRLASWAAAIAVEADKLHHQVHALAAHAGRYGAPPSVIVQLKTASRALSGAATDALTLHPETTVHEGED